MRRMIIISAVCIFILAPLGAWLAVSMKPDHQMPSEEVTPATKPELQAAIEKNIKTLPESQRYYTLRSITSVEQMGKWWYLVMVEVDGIKQEDGGGISKRVMLLAKFKNTPESTKVITQPGKGLHYDNISGGLGVPYSVIDKLNKEIGK